MILAETIMTKPKHLTDECWKLILADKWNIFSFGFAEVGEILETNGRVFKFLGNFARKKDAHALKSETRRVHPYLFGKLKIGWAVIETI